MLTDFHPVVLLLQLLLVLSHPVLPAHYPPLLYPLPTVPHIDHHLLHAHSLTALHMIVPLAPPTQTLACLDPYLNKHCVSATDSASLRHRLQLSRTLSSLKLRDLSLRQSPCYSTVMSGCQTEHRTWHQLKPECSKSTACLKG